MTAVAIVITVVAISLFGAFVLLGAWIDGRRQAVRKRGLHPVTTPEGTVTSQESQAGEQQPERP